MRLYSVLVMGEFGIPAIFLCKDIDGDLYIFHHRKWTDEYSEMVIVPIQEREVISLITKRLALNKFFDEKRESKYIYSVKEYVNGKQIVKKYKTFPEPVFVDVGFDLFLDVEKYDN